MSEPIYETNIKNMRNFFNTNEYKILKNNLEKNYTSSQITYFNENIWLHFIKNAINGGSLANGSKIYQDPDLEDENLYKYVAKQFEKDGYLYTKIENQYGKIHRIKKDFISQNGDQFEILFSLDGIIGWKAIIDYLYRENEFINNEEKFIEIYYKIRKYENAGHLLWPVHESPTINTERYQKFNDRIDYTLFDIKNYFQEKEKTHLKNAYFNKISGEKTAKWLNTFNNFEEFIIKMKLERWCVKKDGKYEVLDLDKDIKKHDNNNIIKEYLCSDEKYCAKEKYPITKQYIENLIKIININ